MPTSSRALIAALEAAGFAQGTGTGRSGTHRTWHRPRPGQSSQTVTVVLGKKEIPTGTLRSMARQAEMSFADFCAMLDLKP